jgi:hypothetical protein
MNSGRSKSASPMKAKSRPNVNPNPHPYGVDPAELTPEERARLHAFERDEDFRKETLIAMHKRRRGDISRKST